MVTAAAASVMLLAGATMAFAQTASTTSTPPAGGSATTTAPAPAPAPSPTPAPSPAPAPTPMPVMHKEARNIVQIGSGGSALIRGMVSAVGATSITVSSWGGDWTINVTAETKMVPKSTSSQLALIRPGDFVGVNGKIDTTRPWTITARVVRDTDAEHAIAMTQKQTRMRIKDIEEKERQNVKNTRKQLFPPRKTGQ